MKKNLWAAALLVLAMPVATQAASLTTMAAANNGQNGNMFDVSANVALTITGLSQNFWGFSGELIDHYQVYYRPGGITGHLDNPAGWILAGSATDFYANPKDTLTKTPAALSIHLNAGETLGLYVTTFDDTVAYTDSNNVGDVAAANADLTIYQGYGRAYFFGDQFSPRTWNGTIEYTVGAVPEPSAVALLVGGLLLTGACTRGRKAGAHRA